MGHTHFIILSVTCIAIWTLQDGEVESFELLDIDKVAKIISETDDFKDNCNLVIIDFLIRHGVLKPESRGYLDLLSGLRQVDCS